MQQLRGFMLQKPYNEDKPIKIKHPSNKEGKIDFECVVRLYFQLTVYKTNVVCGFP